MEKHTLVDQIHALARPGRIEQFVCQRLDARAHVLHHFRREDLMYKATETLVIGIIQIKHVCD